MPWIFGGGTALAVHLSHRVSYDIDAFVCSSDVIRDLTPNRNPVTREILGGRRYEYPGNYLKLCLDHGEIDFIVSSSHTDNPTTAWDFGGTIINIETPCEIVIKKIFYRPSSFKVRDVFDFASVLPSYGDALALALPEVEDRLDKLRDRIALLAPSYEASAVNDVNPTEIGRQFMTRAAPDRVLAFLAGWRTLS